jgi:hypothetical protein
MQQTLHKNRVIVAYNLQKILRQYLWQMSRSDSCGKIKIVCNYNSGNICGKNHVNCLSNDICYMYPYMVVYIVTYISAYMFAYIRAYIDLYKIAYKVAYKVVYMGTYNLMHILAYILAYILA